MQNKLFMHSFVSGFFVFVYAFTWLPYFLQCFLAVLVCFFFGKLIKFACVVCLQVSLGDTSSFLATAVHFPFVFFVLWALIDIYFG